MQNMSHVFLREMTNYLDTSKMTLSVLLLTLFCLDVATKSLNKWIILTTMALF